jgi:ABC-2 type transport system ATP-binding protein
VNRVSFDVRPGEIFALLGPNGAGKTTLIRMITDILRPDEGTVRLDGHPVSEEGRGHISYLPEERGLYKRARLVDVVAYYGELKGMTARAAKDEAVGLLKRVQLFDRAGEQVQTLSKGNQQKLQLCTALIGAPRMLILDEPFSGLDPVNVQLLEEILGEVRAAGAIVLLSTHQMNKVEQLCDRALMINRGHMVLYGTLREIRRQHADHAVRLRAHGPVSPVAGVRRVDAVNGDYKLVLEPGATTNQVLKALLASGVDIEFFGTDDLPLEDIFVKVVRDGVGLDEGRSGPVEPEPEPVGVAR